MKKWMALLAGICMMVSAAAAPGEPVADVQPLPVDPEAMDPANRSFDVQIADMDQTAEKQELKLMRYVTDRYDPEQIRSLSPGDTVLIAGTVYTVKDINIRDAGWEEEELLYEIEPEEEEWEDLWFTEASDGTFLAHVGDWSPVTYVDTVTIPLPLPDFFAYYDYPGGEEAEAATADELLEDILERKPEFFSPYNTTAVFRDGELAEIHNWSYPWGPGYN